MSDEHKAALAKGRTEGRIVRDYLEGLRAHKTQARAETDTRNGSEASRLDRGRIGRREPDGRLLLVQERRDLEAELEAMSNTIDIEALEAAFVEVAKSYSESKSISYASWRDVGVAASVLKQAGVSRAS